MAMLGYFIGSTFGTGIRDDLTTASLLFSPHFHAVAKIIPCPAMFEKA
jgi:hypothetical protein